MIINLTIQYISAFHSNNHETVSALLTKLQKNSES